jgi:putative ABC transport system permease protein
MIGVILTVAGVTAAITFGASLDRLVGQPFRYGSYYDVALGGNGAEQLPDGFTERIDANPDVTSLTRYTDDFARVGELNLPILGMDVISGDGTPPVLSGRIPVSNDEIALGRVSARAIGVDVGDAVTIVGDTDSAVFRVSGLVVMPGFGSNDGLGVGGVVTTSGLARIDDAAPPTILAVQLSSSVAEFATSVPELGDVPPDSTYIPAAIVNVSRIRAIPFALAAVLAALTLLTVGHVMVTSTRGTRRELAILRSLGAGGGWISRAVHWQATLFTLVCATVGVPLGFITGRLVFLAFARNMGTVDDAAIPFALIAVGVVAIVALANAATAVPARRARRLRPAQLLRTE